MPLLVAAAALILGAGFGLRLGGGGPVPPAGRRGRGSIVVPLLWAALALAATLISLLGAVFRVRAGRKAPAECAPPPTEQQLG